MDIPIKTITIPQNVEQVYADAFLACTTLEEVYFENPDCIIGVAAFDLCRHLHTIVLPRNVKELPFYTFRECSALKEVIIPDSVHTITKEQFTNCKKLKKIWWRGHLYTYEDLKTYGGFV